MANISNYEKVTQLVEVVEKVEQLVEAIQHPNINKDYMKEYYGDLFDEFDDADDALSAIESEAEMALRELEAFKDKISNLRERKF